MDWESTLNEKMEELRESFHQFIENGGSEEECVNVLNDSLGYMGIHSYFAEPNSTNSIHLPPTEALAEMYARRQPNVASPGYRTPVRPSQPLSRAYVTPSNKYGTPFSPPKMNEPSRKRSRMNHIYRNNNNNNNNNSATAEAIAEARLRTRRSRTRKTRR